MATSASSSTQRPPKKIPKIIIDLTSNESSPITPIVPIAPIDTTLALSIHPITTAPIEPFASPLAPRALVFTTPPNTPIETHPYLSTTSDAPPRPTNPFPTYITQDIP